MSTVVSGVGFSPVSRADSDNPDGKGNAGEGRVGSGITNSEENTRPLTNGECSPDDSLLHRQRLHNTMKNSDRLSGLFLRPLNPEDVTNSYVTWLNDKSIVRFLEIRHTNEPFNLKSVKQFIVDCHHNKRYHWGIYHRKRHVGNVSCSAYSRRYRWADISVLVGDRSYQNKGIGRISTASAVDHLLMRSGFRRIKAGAYSSNHSSINLFLSLGFRKERIEKESVLVEGKWIDTVGFGILKNEWQERRHQYQFVDVFPHQWEEIENS